MTAQTLIRDAAKILRAEANKATPGVWKLWGMSVMADQNGTSNVETAVDVARTLYRDDAGKPRTFDAAYIAAMQPRVGLALADWLDSEADFIPPGATHYGDGIPISEAPAVRVARAILGGDA